MTFAFDETLFVQPGLNPSAGFSPIPTHTFIHAFDSVQGRTVVTRSLAIYARFTRVFVIFGERWRTAANSVLAEAEGSPSYANAMPQAAQPSPPRGIKELHRTKDRGCLYAPTAANCAGIRFRVELMKMVVRLLPFHCTTAPLVKLVPLTVKMNAGPPAVSDCGDLAEMASAWLMEKLTELLASGSGPAAALQLRDQERWARRLGGLH